MIDTTVPPLIELRVWLTTAEEMLDRQMESSDPRYAAAYEAWEERHNAYMVRAWVEGEPE